MATFAESHVEDAALDWLQGLGYQILHGPDISPDGPIPERAGYDDVVLWDRFRAALEKLNPDPRGDTEAGLPVVEDR
jgi:type I restriction enzyme R subunit